MSKRLSIVSLSFSLLGCASAPATPLPPPVLEIVQAECGRCHAAQPRGGAPMSLVTWEAMHAPAVTDPSLRVFQMVARRIHDEADPMPATGLLPSADLAVLDDWIAAGAPPGDGTYVPPPVQEVGPSYLPCEPTAEFRAHAPGSDTEPFVLEPGAGDQGNATMCFAFASPFDDITQGTAFAPIIEEARVLHHWIIFGTDALPAGIEVGDVWACGATGGGLTTGSQFLTGWAPGGVNEVYPEDRGRELPGPGGFIVLQVHYWNVAGYTDVADRSGVALCTTNTPRINEVGTSILGSLDIAIEPRANDHTVVGTCTPAITEPVTIVASAPHMHTRGVHIRTEVLRGGMAGPSESLVDVARWDFNSQTSIPAPDGSIVVQPGDVLRTTCVYDNDTADLITFGERTEDEMCFNFVSAYPTGALATEAGRSRRLCID